MNKRLIKKEKLTGMLSVYSGLLTDKENRVLELYLSKRLNGSAVARELKISRQAVHDHIKRATERIENCEKKVKLFKKRSKRTRELEKLSALIDDLIASHPDIEELKEAKKIVIRIKKNN